MIVNWPTYLVKYIARPKKKTCPFPISYRPCPITCYSKVFLGVLEILEKIPPKHTFFSNLASHYHVFSFRMYFYKSIFILNGAITYLVWHALFKFSHIPPFTQKSKIKKNKKIKTFPYLPTHKLKNKSETDFFFSRPYDFDIQSND